MSRLEAVGVNAPQIEYWNGPAGDKWARLAESQDRMLVDLGAAAMRACDIRPGHSVLDVGCGSGSTTIEIARQVGPSGRVLGVDISTPQLGVARSRLDASGIGWASLENRDVATCPFEAGAFDRVFSRFGVMFFVDPPAAFANIRRALKSGGRLAFVCWQALDRNPWMAIPVAIALRHAPAPPPADPRAPGPMAFADPARVRTILSEAGFADTAIEPLETPIPLEPDVPGTVQKLLQTGPVSRLLGDTPDEVIAQIESDLGAAISGYQTANGVLMDSATWIVTAMSP